MSKDREELIKLRVGIARIAQQLGIDHEIPGEETNGTFEALSELAGKQERGWHRLLGCIGLEVGDLMKYG